MGRWKGRERGFSPLLPLSHRPPRALYSLPQVPAPRAAPNKESRCSLMTFIILCSDSFSCLSSKFRCEVALNFEHVCMCGYLSRIMAGRLHGRFLSRDIRTGNITSVNRLHDLADDRPLSHFCSMFVLLEGATKERAFQVGREIVDAVTAVNPKPVKLKFEKVRSPAVVGDTAGMRSSAVRSPRFRVSGYCTK